MEKSIILGSEEVASSTSPVTKGKRGWERDSNTAWQKHELLSLIMLKMDNDQLTMKKQH